MPVALLLRVHREQVERARRDQPQHLRTLQVQAAETGAVDPHPQLSQRADDDVVHGSGRHLTAP